MEEIGVVVGYAVVIATIAVVLFGVIMLFILSIRPSAQSTPQADVEASGAHRYDSAS